MDILIWTREGDREKTQSSSVLTNKKTNTNTRKQTIQMSCKLQMSRDASEFEALCKKETHERFQEDQEQFQSYD